MRVFTDNQVDEIYGWLIAYERKEVAKETMLTAIRSVLLNGERVKWKAEKE